MESLWPDFGTHLLPNENVLYLLSEKFAEISCEQANEARDAAIVQIADAQGSTEIRHLAAPTEEEHDLHATVRDAINIYRYRARADHPRFFGFIPSPVSWIAQIGEMLNTVYNPLPASWYQASGVVTIEECLLSWLGERIGLPSSVGGIFLSGGSMSNLSALILARDQRLPSADFERGIVYLSDQTHSSIFKACHMLGFDSGQIRTISTDESLRMSPHELEEQIKCDIRGDFVPFVVIATCGTTNVGAIDPLLEISKVAARYRIWLHVDGAYGASVSLSHSYADAISGLEHVDSVSWDAHKWLFQTYGCGVLLVKERKHLRQSFATSAEYLEDAGNRYDSSNFWDLGPELTRPARAMKLWFTLRVIGTKKLGHLIDHGIHVAEVVESEMRKLENWEVVTPASLGIVTFSIHSRRGTIELRNKLHERICEEASLRGVGVFLTSKVRGRAVVRMCSTSPLLSLSEAKELVLNLDSILRELVN